MLNRTKCCVGLHAWTEWQYVKDESCEQTRHCVQCGVSQVKIRRHEFREWRYVEEKSCKQTLNCTRCSAILDERVEHDMSWDERIYTRHNVEYVDQTGRCRRCDYEDSRTGLPGWYAGRFPD
jgi:hypothetical protein